MIGSVRAGLGLAPPLPQTNDGSTIDDTGGVDNNSDDIESQASSSRSVMMEVSEYCPTMTYQQVSFFVSGGTEIFCERVNEEERDVTPCFDRIIG